MVTPCRSGYLMKIASRPTTIARTPRPSANAARMIAMPRIWPAASGLRPIAVADEAAEDADADAGADDAEGGETGADVLHVVTSSYFPGDAPGICWDRWWAAPSAPQCAGWGAASIAVGGLERLLGDVALLVVVALDREHDEHERQDAEDQRLDDVEHELEADAGRPG